MEGELFQVREDLNRLMVRNASTFSSTEKRDHLRAPPTFSAAASSLQQELQEIAVRRDQLRSQAIFIILIIHYEKSRRLANRLVIRKPISE